MQLLRNRNIRYRGMIGWNCIKAIYGNRLAGPNIQSASQKLERKGLTFSFVLLLTFLLPIQANAVPGDTTGPVVSAITVTPASVDVTLTSQVVTATVQVTDVSGVDVNRLPSPYWYHSLDIQGTRINSTWALVTGDIYNGTYSSSVTIPVGVRPGSWLMGSTAFYDTLGFSSTNGGYGQNFTVVTTPVDAVNPVITLLGNTTVQIIQGAVYSDAGATALDNVDGNLTGSITVNNLVNTSVIGTYTVTYNVTDAAGNTATSVVRTVNVVAGMPPVITLIGATPVTLVQGATYNDGGATALDDVDGNVTANIATLNHVNTAVVASYTVTYNVSDAAGNAATQVVRTVNVIPVAGAANRGEAVQVPLTGNAAAVEITSIGEVISNFSSAAAGGTPPAGVTVPLGVLSYTTTIPAGAISHTVDLTFSSPLPANFVLYKVDNAGLYSTIPNGTGVDQWTQVNATTIALTLSDGGPFDLGGTVPDGIIIDPVAVGVPPAPVVAAPAATGGGGGGCSINPSAPFDPAMLLLLLFAFIGLVRQRNDV